MNFYDSKIFIDDLRNAIDSSVGIEKLNGSSVMITGACGLIGSFITDMLLLCNKEKNSNINIYALDLNLDRLSQRFEAAKTNNLTLIEHNVNDLPAFDFHIDYIIHAASNAFPAAFDSDPVGTIMSNIQGTKYLLDYGRDHGAKRLLYISSGEVYGQGEITLDAFEESYSGYVDPISPRSCYPCSKRCAETLCVSYTKQYALETVIIRPSHTYGANATKSDNRANVQFINKAVAGENIVLNSAGTQLRSYTYIADTASAILTALSVGKTAEAYNIANPDSTITIAGLAKIIADKTGVELIFSDPDEVQKAQLSPIPKQVLDPSKLLDLGWTPKYTITDGIGRVLGILGHKDKRKML